MDFISKKRNIYLISIFVIAISIRIIANAFLQGLSSPQNPGFPDYVAYIKIAKSLAFDGYFGYDGVPKTRFPPGIPFLIAGIFKVFGDNYVVLRIFYCFMGAITCVMLYFISLNFVKKEAVALTSSLIMALYPPHIYYSMHFGTEVPLLLLLSTMFLVYIKAKSDDKIVSYIYIGVIFCLTMYTHAAQLIYVIVFSGLILLCNKEISKLKYFLVTIPVCIILLLPWTYRNSVITGQISTTSTHGGSTLWDGNNPITYNDPRFKGGDTGRLLGLLKDTNQLETIKGYEEYKAIEKSILKGSESSFTKLSINYIQNNLSKIPEITMWKLYKGITPVRDSPNKTVNVAFYLTYLFINLFGLLGLILVVINISKYESSILLFSQLIYFVLITVIFFGIQRYRIFMNTSEIFFAAVGCVWILEKLGLSLPISFDRVPAEAPISGA